MIGKPGSGGSSTARLPEAVAILAQVMVAGASGAKESATERQLRVRNGPLWGGAPGVMCPRLLSRVREDNKIGAMAQLCRCRVVAANGGFCEDAGASTPSANAHAVLLVRMC